MKSQQLLDIERKSVMAHTETTFKISLLCYLCVPLRLFTFSDVCNKSTLQSFEDASLSSIYLPVCSQHPSGYMNTSSFNSCLSDWSLNVTFSMKISNNAAINCYVNICDFCFCFLSSCSKREWALDWQCPVRGHRRLHLHCQKWGGSGWGYIVPFCWRLGQEDP